LKLILPLQGSKINMRTSRGFGLKQAGFNHEETLNLLKRSSTDQKQKTPPS
jgi:hypothetical protein